ncbi:polysaccharide biosynthesis/export family protein [Sodalinema gerasimenkoae]|uniref:polysaccharide biosynthesis/export family protein n=1 Tax=Sodalinema gerasimenkoae TaxID=2862348 RepID=UPI001357B754|nr:polysaccharide biosynthesis/export family protein [Sodalinema gerasimenkoae]
MLPSHFSHLPRWRSGTALLSGAVLVAIQLLPIQTAIAQTEDERRILEPTVPQSRLSPQWRQFETQRETEHLQIMDYLERWLRDRIDQFPASQQLPPGILQDSRRPPQQQVPIDSIAWDEYRLGIGDGISIVVQPPFQDLSTTAQISFQGTIFVPLLGTVNLQGLTVDQAANLLETSLNRFVVNPDVQVVLAQPRQSQITVTGEVDRPGFFPIAPNSPLVQALLTAGGVTMDADLREVTVERRFPDGERISQTFDLHTPLTLGQAIPDVRLRDGDVVRVATRPREFDSDYDRDILQRTALVSTTSRPIAITITGEVVRPGYYETNSRPAPEVDDVLIAAQGTKTTADLRRILVRRRLPDGTAIERELDLFTPLLEGRPLPRLSLEDGDVIIVPEIRPEDRESYDVELMARTTFSQQRIVVRLVSRPGNAAGPQDLPAGSRLADAVAGVPINTARLGRVALIRFDEEVGEPVTEYYDVREAIMGNMEENPLLQDRDVIVVGRNLIAQLGNFLNTFTQPFRDVLGFLLFFDQLSNSANNLFGPTGDGNNQN